MKYYLTTPIYYVNATPHIGHAYTTLVADTVKRVRRMMGDDVYLCTGTDEHGQKVERSAEKAGWTPQEFTDRVSGAFRADWDELGIDYDFFVRTTEERHAKTVQWLFERCQANGFIKKDSYTGKYDVTSEAFVTDEEAEKISGPVEVVTEENYFFKLSEFQDRLLKLYEDNPDFIRPESRRNEVISFVKGGLKDLSISRATLKWGIPLPNDSGARVLCVVRCADELHDGAGLRRRRSRPEEPVAGGRAYRRQRDSAVSCGLLAGVSDGRRTAAPQGRVRAWLAHLPRREDEQDEGEHCPREADR